MRNWQQIVSGDLQLKQAPVLAQGVDRPKRWAFVVAATLRARFIAPSTSEQTLFMPTIITTFFGPWAMAATRLELPSMFTSTPSFVMALQLARNTSASKAASAAACGSENAARSMKL